MKYSDEPKSNPYPYARDVCSTIAPPIERRPEIVSEFERLEKSIAVLGDSLDRLGMTLTPVMRNGPFDTGNMGKADREVSSPFANNLRNLSDRVVLLNGNVVSILDLLEL